MNVTQQNPLPNESTPTESKACPFPRYVLHSERQPIGPEIAPDASGTVVNAIYGFSGKPAYDAFLANSEGDLRPYPLMKGYLERILAERGDVTNLVIIDAGSPVSQSIQGVKFQSVLEAESHQASQLLSDFQLLYCENPGGYRFVEVAA